jgi:hypothetical protein
MCVKCLEAVKELFPGIKPRAYWELLYECTCFPFGDAGDIRRQLKAIAKRHDKAGVKGYPMSWVAGEIARAEKATEREMRKYHKG